MQKVAVISAILEEAENSQVIFNDTIAHFKGIIRGRMGVPLPDHDITVITITVIGELDEINSLTGKLGRIPNVSVKTSISKKVI